MHVVKLRKNVHLQVLMHLQFKRAKNNWSKKNHWADQMKLIPWSPKCPSKPRLRDWLHSLALWTVWKLLFESSWSIAHSPHLMAIWRPNRRRSQGYITWQKHCLRLYNNGTFLWTVTFSHNFLEFPSDEDNLPGFLTGRHIMYPWLTFHHNLEILKKNSNM